MVQDIQGANDQDPSTIGRASQSVPSVRTPNAKSAGLAIPMALNVIAWDPIFVNVNVLSASDPDRTAPKTPTGGVILSPSMAKPGPIAPAAPTPTSPNAAAAVTTVAAMTNSRRNDVLVEAIFLIALPSVLHSCPTRLSQEGPTIR